jgi:hypothetical protein
MSMFGKQGVRCDWCGKFSADRFGEYRKPDGIHFGRIRQPEWEREHYDADGKHAPIDSEFDICEECAANLCPNCGSDQVVRVTPMTPGPDGWGGWCKACEKRWSMPTD